MKIKTIPFSLLILCLISSLFCFGKPKIEFDEIKHNFGEVDQHISLVHTFLFTNTGDGMLTIKKIKAGWGCTGVLLSEKNIPAGSMGEIEVTLKTGSRKGITKKSIYVHTNDEEKKKIKLSVTANISENPVPEYWRYDNPIFRIINAINQKQE